MLNLSTLIVLAFASLALAASPDHTGIATIETDVVIIGGGSGGTHAAIKLKQKGHSVTLIEKNDRLGGHVNTYTDPATKKTFDYGVIVFTNSTVSRGYLSSLGVELKTFPSTFSAPSYANFHTDGKILPHGLPSYIPYSNQTAVGLALYGWLQQLEKYPFLEPGHGFPDTVPDDLLLPLGDFLKKYSLEAVVSPVSSICEGVGNILAESTLYIMKYFDIDVTKSYLGIGLPLVVEVNLDNQSIYNKALARLGSSVLLSSTVKKVTRSPSAYGSSSGAVTVHVNTPAGPKIIKAKKLVVAIKPLLQSLEDLGLDLDLAETDVFRQLNSSYYWDLVIKNPGIPPDVSLVPIDLKAPLGIPAAPLINTLSGGNLAGIPDVSASYFTSPHYLSTSQVKQQVLAALNKVNKANHFAKSTPEVIEIHNHSPFQVTVSVEAIKKGFYKSFNGLQGHRDTFYVGAAWSEPNSEKVWSYTESTVLPPLEKSL